VQELAATEAEGLAMVTAEEVQEGNTAASEASDSPKVPEGNFETSHTDVEIVELGSSSPSDFRSNSPSSSSSVEFTPLLTKFYPHHHQPKPLKSLTMIHLCQCIPLFKRG